MAELTTDALPGVPGTAGFLNAPGQIPVAATTHTPYSGLVVVSAVHEPLGWSNSRLAKADLLGEVRSLKAEGGDSLRTIGSLSMVKALMVAGLVDRLRLVVFPLILGETGREWIFAGLRDIGLELVGTAVLDGRLVTLEYRPVAAE